MATTAPQQGTFEVIVRRADNLHDTKDIGWNAKIDPYVKCLPSWLPKEKKTNWQATKYVDNGGTTIVFDEIKHSAKLTFPMPEKTPAKPVTLFIEVYDFDNVGGHDFIGSAEYDIFNLLSNKKGGSKEVAINLTRPKKKTRIEAGTVFLQLTSIPPVAPVRAKPAKKKPTKKKGKKGKKDNKAPALSPRAAKTGTREALKILQDYMKENDISIKDAFEMADEGENEDGEEEYDNSASYDEFKEMVANLVNDEGQEDLLTPAQIALIVQHVDSDNNGTINIEEFTSALTNKISPGTTLDVLMAQMASTWGEDDNNGADCFELFDGDGSGTMSYEEFETNLIELFDSLNYNTLASEEEKQLAKNNIGRLQKHFDQNLDGHIHSVEFRAALQSKLVPPTTTITTVDEDNNVVEQEVNTADMDAVQSNAEVIRQQRVLVGVDMTLKTGTLHVRVKRGDLMHDTSGFGDKKMDPYVCGCGLVVGCGCGLVVGWLLVGCGLVVGWTGHERGLE